MGKHETPAFRMKIERGRLIPVTAFDAERLDSYQNGSELRVSITQPKNDKLLRKYWAILGKVVADCPTPWTNKDQASEALKLSLGIVDYGKTVSDKFFQYPKSLTELDDPEFRAYYDDAMALLHKITGVDPEQLGAESPDVGEDPETSAAPSADVGGEVARPDDLTSAPAADEAAKEPGDDLVSSGEGEPGSTTLSDEDKDNLLALIKRLKAAVGEDADVVRLARNSFANEGRVMGKLAKDKATAIYEQFKKACGIQDEDKSRKALSEAVTMACGIAQIDELELGMI